MPVCRRDVDRRINDLGEDPAFLPALRRRRAPPPTLENLPTVRLVNTLGDDDYNRTPPLSRVPNTLSALGLAKPSERQRGVKGNCLGR